jgi:hypothetical protein
MRQRRLRLGFNPASTASKGIIAAPLQRQQYTCIHALPFRSVVVCARVPQSRCAWVAMPV